MSVTTRLKSAFILLFWGVLYFTSIKVNTPVNFAPSDQDVELQNDLSTIDKEGFAGLSTNVALNTLPSSPQLPSVPETPTHHTVDTSVAVSTPASEELIRSCATPQKVESIQRALEKLHEWHCCALTLLPYFFTKEGLTRSNMDGYHGKEHVDATQLNSIKVLIFSKFPQDCH